MAHHDSGSSLSIATQATTEATYLQSPVCLDHCLVTVNLVLSTRRKMTLLVEECVVEEAEKISKEV